MNNVSMNPKYNLVFGAKISQKALKMACKPVGNVVKKSEKEITAELSKLNTERFKLVAFLDKNPNNIDARKKLDSITSAINSLRVDLMNIMK